MGGRLGGWVEKMRNRCLVQGQALAFPCRLAEAPCSEPSGREGRGLFLDPQPFPSDPCVLALELRCFDPWCSVVSFDTCNSLRLY